MRIRHYREIDMPTLLHIWQMAAIHDSLDQEGMEEVERWLAQLDREAAENLFVITDDDDEINSWSQAGTLDGVEGEMVGFTMLRLLQDANGYHFRCVGAVHPAHRGMSAGRALLISALNSVRMHSAEFEFEAEEQGIPIYFEALLPARNPASARLAERYEMQPTGEIPLKGMKLYRREL